MCVVDWHLRKHERTPSDTYNHCSEARHRAAIFVLMTSLPSLLVSVFMFWLGYSIEPASDLQWCVCVCVCFLFCTSQCSGKCSYKTVCQPVLSLSSMKSTHFPSICGALSVCLYSHASFCIGLPAYSQAHGFTHTVSMPLT